jgi:UDP-glucose 4-epimerase
MKYLVTGGAGFIGSHIVDALIGQGHDVVVLDNLSSGHRENLTQVMDRISFIEGDVRDPDACLQASEGCDGMFHEAALVSVADSVERPRDNHEINMTGMLNVLEAARTNGVKRVVFASSAAIYGNNPELPKTEEMRPEPMSPYAVAKITGEYYLRTYAELYGLECVALRYFNVYGPRQDPSSPYSGVISIFSTRVGKGQPITIYGDGEQTRDFVNVADVVSANLTAMTVGFPATSNAQLPIVNFSVFNVATGKQHTLLDLLDHLESVAGNTVVRNFAPARAGDIRHSFASSKKLQALGWQPSVEFREGLQRLLDSL